MSLTSCQLLYPAIIQPALFYHNLNNQINSFIISVKLILVVHFQTGTQP